MPFYDTKTLIFGLSERDGLVLDQCGVSTCETARADTSAKSFQKVQGGDLKMSSLRIFFINRSIY